MSAKDAIASGFAITFLTGNLVNKNVAMCKIDAFIWFSISLNTVFVGTRYYLSLSCGVYNREPISPTGTLSSLC